MHGRDSIDWAVSENGTRREFTAGAVMRRLRDRRVGPAFIPPGRSRHNGFAESFNGKLRDECLNREWFRDLCEARMLIEQWREFYNLATRNPLRSPDEVLRTRVERAETC